MIVQIKNIINRYHLWLIPVIFMLLAYINVAYLAHFKLVYFNSDYMFHLNRIKGLQENILSGQFPLISKNATVPYGITLSYYPWLTIAPFALIALFIKNPVTLFYTIVAIINFVTYLTSYFSYKTIDKSVIKALFFSLLYTNSSVLFNWNFRSGDFGATLAMAFAPLALFGFINLMQKNQHSIMMTTGIILVLASHIITGGLLTLSLVFLGIINIKKFQLTALLKAFGGMIAAIIVMSIFWYPMLKISAANSIVMPAVFKSVSSGILNYVGSSTNYLYGMIDIVGLVSIVKINGNKFKLLDFEMWLIGLMSIVINSYWVADPLSKVFPILLKLQFTYRFGLIAHVFLTLLAMKLLMGEFDPSGNAYRTPILLVSVYVLMTPIVNQYSFQFLMKSRPTIESFNQFLKLNDPDNKNNQFQYTFSKTSYQVLNHYFYNYDYVPNEKVGVNEAFDLTYKTAVYNNDNKWQRLIHFNATDKGITINNHHYRNVQLPIVIYHGIKYQFTLNGKQMSERYINQQLTNQTYRLTLKNLPNGNNTVSIKSASLK